MKADNYASHWLRSNDVIFHVSGLAISLYDVITSPDTAIVRILFLLPLLTCTCGSEDGLDRDRVNDLNFGWLTSAVFFLLLFLFCVGGKDVSLGVIFTVWVGSFISVLVKSISICSPNTVEGDMLLITGNSSTIGPSIA